MPPIRSPRAPTRQRRQTEVSRPIASSLPLSESHVMRIDQSHERCAALGLPRIGRPDHAPLDRPELVLVRERNRRLYTHAAPLMEMLFDQIAGTQSMVVLCDDTGTIIHSIGDAEFLSRASRVALQPGVNWSEHAKGTNAIGTALIEELPTLVHADEHYMHANHFLTCSATPIMDPRGNMLGVLDVSGDRAGYHQHTMALVRMSARMIENHWLADDFRHAMRLHFHGRADCIDTLMEGILAVSSDGRIVGANRSALEQLELSGAALRMHGLSSLFGITVGALVDRFRSPLAAPLPARTGSGRQFHLHARFNWPVWSHVTEAAAVAAPPPTATVLPAAMTLARLQTGDAQIELLLGKLRRVLDSGIPILILGETGTGKETLARAMHLDSARAHRPFVAIDCAATPASPTPIEALGDGTLFLDRVDELPATQQAHWMSVLRDRPPAVICAARQDLCGRVDAGTFRKDLYYRLNGLALTLPPLRERTDLAALVRQILERDAGGRRLKLAPEVLRLFESHPWPGNLRQLCNVLASASLLAGADHHIGLAHLPDDFLDAARRRGQRPVPPAASLQDQELATIRRTLDAAGGNVSDAARRLGVSRNTIYRKLRQGRQGAA